MLTALNLINSGYQECEDAAAQKGEYCENLYQKRVLGPKGETLYFIDIFEWSLPVVGHKWEIEVSLFTEKFTLRLNCLDVDDFRSIEEIEAFYADAYARLACVPDKHNN